MEQSKPNAHHLSQFASFIPPPLLFKPASGTLVFPILFMSSPFPPISVLFYGLATATA